MYMSGKIQQGPMKIPSITKAGEYIQYRPSWSSNQNMSVSCGKGNNITLKSIPRLERYVQWTVNTYKSREGKEPDNLEQFKEDVRQNYLRWMKEKCRRVTTIYPPIPKKESQPEPTPEPKPAPQPKSEPTQQSTPEPTPPKKLTPRPTIGPTPTRIIRETAQLPEKEPEKPKFNYSIMTPAGVIAFNLIKKWI